MANHTRESVSSQVDLQLKDVESAGALPFRHLLRVETVLAGLQGCGIEFRDRVFSPMVTLWAFLSQVTSRKDSSC
jgi:hypothetical protein